MERAVAAAIDGASVGQRANRSRVPLAGRNIAEAIATAVVLLVRLLSHELIEHLGRLGARERTGRRKGSRRAAGDVGLVAGHIQQTGRLRAGAAAVIAIVAAHLGDVLFQQRHGLLERDGAAVIERADDRHDVLQVHVRRGDELGQKLRDLIIREDAARDVRQDGVDAGLRHAESLQDLGKRLLGCLAVRAAGGNVADDLAEVDVHRVAGNGDDAVHVVVVAGNILEQIAHIHVHDTVDKVAVAGNVIDKVAHVHADDAVDEVAVADDVINEVVDVHAHDAVNEVIPVDNVDAIENVRERGYIALALQGLDAKRRCNGHGRVAKQLRHRADIEQAAIRQAAEQSCDVRQADFSGRGKLIDHGGCLIVAERAGRDGVDDAAALDLGHAGVREQLGQERAGGLTARVLLLRILESKAVVDIDAVIDHGHDAVRVITVAGDVLEQIADRHAHDAVGEIAVAADMVDQIFDVHADDAVDKVIVVGDVDLAQDLTEQTVVQLAIGRVGCAALRFRICRESRDCSEAECQHEGQYQTQRLAHFFIGFCLL